MRLLWKVEGQLQRTEVASLRATRLVAVVNAECSVVRLVRSGGARRQLCALPRAALPTLDASLLDHGCVLQAATAVHNDDDFQRDAGAGKLQRVVDAVQADPKLYAKYAAAPTTADALAKLQRFHTLVKANGGATVSVQQLIVEADHVTTAVSDSRVS